MGTEIAVSFSTLRDQLETEKSSLFKIDESIKRIVLTTGRSSDRYNNPGGDGRLAGRLGGRNSYPESNNFNKSEDLFGKRKHETKTVFSRLSGRVGDSDNEDEETTIKRNRVSSTVSRELPTRAAVVRAQTGDEQARNRNRRMFGSLLGTLQKFKQEEIGLQTKEDKKAQVEKKIEEQARLEKEQVQKERKTLFAEREQKKAKIKALEAKMGRVQEFEKWEENHKCLKNFILTKAKPHLYWLPKRMEEKATAKLESSRKYNEKTLETKRMELQDELERIEQRCLRPRGFAAKENRHKNESQDLNEDDGNKKRDKFATDDKDTDDDHHDNEHHENEHHNNGHHDIGHHESKHNNDVDMAEVTQDSIEKQNNENVTHDSELNEESKHDDSKEDKEKNKEVNMEVSKSADSPTQTPEHNTEDSKMDEAEQNS